MMKKQVHLENINEIAKEIRSKLNKNTILIIEGELGAGKTTLIKHIVGQDGHQAVSPSFLHLLLYGNNFAHIDAYTLQSKEALFSLSIEEILEERCLIVEWGELFLNELRIFDAKILHLIISIKDDNRFIELKEIK